ncbi:MAG: nickel pincer cofactor biosynthesis protein LarB [Pirellulales bacterium]
MFGENKSAETIVAIAKRLIDRGQPEVLVTRCESAKLADIVSNFSSSLYDSLARTLRLSAKMIGGAKAAQSIASGNAEIMVVTAGSTDLPVAREALQTLLWMGVQAELLTDVGVAGPYRLLPHLTRLRTAKAIVICAGMEGALASVMGGLVACPVIAVPTSVGYGANLQGITTLLSMISSCAAGVTVVNIDAGFKGGYVAGLIATRRSTEIHNRF